MSLCGLRVSEYGSEVDVVVPIVVEFIEVRFAWCILFYVLWGLYSMWSAWSITALAFAISSACFNNSSRLCNYIFCCSFNISLSPHALPLPLWFALVSVFVFVVVVATGAKLSLRCGLNRAAWREFSRQMSVNNLASIYTLTFYDGWVGECDDNVVGDAFDTCAFVKSLWPMSLLSALFVTVLAVVVVAAPLRCEGDGNGHVIWQSGV